MLTVVQSREGRRRMVLRTVKCGASGSGQRERASRAVIGQTRLTRHANEVAWEKARFQPTRLRLRQRCGNFNSLIKSLYSFYLKAMV